MVKTNFLFGLGILLFVGCSTPDDDIVRKEFLAEHPNAELVFVGVGEGDSDNAYYHIQYKLSEDDHVLEKIWLYQKNYQGEWRVTKKSRAAEFVPYN